MMFISSTIIEEIKTMQKSEQASLAMYYYDFREDKKRDLYGLLSSCYSNFAASPIPTTLSFPLSIRHTSMAHEPPVTTNLFVV
jgi:hypothetical protein